MKKLMNVCICVLLWLALVTSFACTSQERAKRFGGTSRVELASGKKLVMITWKNSDLWILTKPMAANDVAETYEFKESSSYGVMEGTIVIVEKK